MKLISFKDLPTYKRGRTVEETIANILIGMDYYVIPSYDYSGDERNLAPKIHGLDESLIIPDLDVSKEGVRIWIEVKSKTKADYTRITSRLEHGIPLRHYKSYLKIQDITGCRVYLYVYEENTLLLLYKILDELKPRIYNGDKMSRGGMTFFARDNFDILGMIVSGKLIDLDTIKDIKNATNSDLPEMYSLLNSLFNLDCDLGHLSIISRMEF